MNASRPSSIGISAWIAIATRLAHICAEARPRDTADRLREALGLLQIAPAALELWIEPCDDPARFEMMLAAQAYDSAALALLGRHTGFMLSRGPNGVCLASVILADAPVDITAEGANAALALLGAQLLALVQTADRVPAQTVFAASSLLN